MLLVEVHIVAAFQVIVGDVEARPHHVLHHRHLHRRPIQTPMIVQLVSHISPKLIVDNIYFIKYYIYEILQSF